MLDSLKHLADLPDDYKRLKENWQRLFQENVGLARIKPIIENRAFLQKLMMAYYSQHDDGASIYWIEEAGIVCPLLSQRTWIPDHLWDLDKIALGWDDAAPPAKPLWQGLAQKLRNECNINIQNNLTYRLTNVQASDKGITAMFNNGWYEEYIETCEALTWELGQALLSTSGKSAPKRLTSQKILDEIKPHLSRRTSVSPFDMDSRSMTPGINTLTVVVTPKLNTMTFLMHHRGGGKGKGLAEAIGTWHIVPAGTFQPLSKNDTYRHIEFSIWRNILREFGEELLDKEELIRQESLLDPEAPFRDDEDLEYLYKIFESGGVDIRFLGLALDCVTLKPEILTLLIIDGNRLASRWKELSDNWEGAHQIIPFDRENLTKWLQEPKLLPAAAGCIALTLKNYEEVIAAIEACA